MCSSSVPALLWGYWANIVYIIGMIGYLTIDTISYMHTSFNSTVSFIIYIILAIIFVIDAVLYTIDWYMYAVNLRKTKDEPIQYRCEFVACIFQNLGSYLYLIGALLSFDKIRLIKKILLFNFIGIVFFLIDSIFTLIGWIITFRKKPSNNPKNGCTVQNVYIWAHILNIIANLLYLSAIVLAYYFYITYKIFNSNSVPILQIIGDLVYLLDAYLYHKCWQRDKEEYIADLERQDFNEFHLEKLNHENKRNENK